MRYLSVCSGIEAASCAWEPLGWEPAGFSEIDNFPCAVLKYHYPKVPNLGDMTKYKEWQNVGSIGLLAGGTPCQSFSIAGLRAGLDDPRGNLMLTFGAIAGHFKPTWIVWENVPGVLSSNKGRDFGTFLGMLGQLGYGFAYRILDAQFFGVPQRRRRVFVVGHLGDWRRAAAVLFESESLQGHPAPSRKKGKEIARSLRGRANASHREDSDNYVSMTLNDKGGLGRIDGESETFVTGTLCANGKAAGSATQQDAESGMLVTHTLRGEGFDASEDGCGRGTPLTIAPTLRAMPNQGPGRMADDAARMGMVRRLTPRECERLQGFPDDWTLIPWRGKKAENCPDGPRYRAIGNSMAVPVMRWIGQRIQRTMEIYGIKQEGKDE
jgi:DNA (cytosine-5)-methyltransferase 1